MKVSILVPIYGVESYIAVCAQALFSQTYRQLEYIFVDDCTPDASVECLQRVLQQFPERKEQVQILHHEKNRGLGAARLTALQKATGDAVMFVDSDDSLSLDLVERMVERMQQTDCDIVDAPHALWNGTEETAQVPPFSGSTENYLRLMLCHNMESPHIWGRLYRRQLFVEHDIWPVEGIDYGEDLAVVPRLMYYGSRAVVGEGKYLYREDNRQSYTHTISQRAHQSFLRANRLLFDFFLEKADSGKYLIALRMGFVDLYRHAARFHLPMTDIDQLGTFWRRCPGSRLCVWLYQKGCYRLATTLYLISRRCYREWILK